MTKKTIDFIFDFGSPNAYFAYKALPAIAAKYDADINYIPCLLGGIFKSTNNQAPMLSFGHVTQKMAYMQLEMSRFIKKHGLTKFKFNSSFPVNTLILMRGAIAAQADGKLPQYIEAGMAAMWEDNEKMDDPDTFARVMSAAGLNGVNLLARTQDAKIKAELMRNTEAAVERGSFGIPTFYVGDEMFFGKDRLHMIEDLLAAG
ncbi:MAG: 2-hydroxychromene-2-carboxylate isomerase [Maricaulaceae bacterium]